MAHEKAYIVFTASFPPDATEWLNSVLPMGTRQHRLENGVDVEFSTYSDAVFFCRRWNGRMGREFMRAWRSLKQNMKELIS